MKRRVVRYVDSRFHHRGHAGSVSVLENELLFALAAVGTGTNEMVAIASTQARSNRIPCRVRRRWVRVSLAHPPRCGGATRAVEGRPAAAEHDAPAFPAERRAANPGSAMTTKSFSATRPGTSWPHVLLVDDDRRLVNELAPFLRRAGVVVVPACEGREAHHPSRLSSVRICSKSLLRPRTKRDCAAATDTPVI